MGLSLSARLHHLTHWSAVLFLTGLIAVLPFATASGVSDESGGLDCRQTLRVRQALAREPALGKLNLGVTVRSSSARLWGDVNDGQQARRALQERAHFVTAGLPPAPARSQSCAGGSDRRKRLDLR